VNAVYRYGYQGTLVVASCDQASIYTSRCFRYKTHILNLSSLRHLVDQKVWILVPDISLVNFILLNELLADDQYLARVLVLLRHAKLHSHLKLAFFDISMRFLICQIVIKLGVEEMDIRGIVVQFDRDKAAIFFEF